MDTSLFCWWLFWFLGAGLLGFLLAWLLRGNNTGNSSLLESDLNEQKNAYNKLQGQHKTLVDKSNAWTSERQKWKKERNTFDTELSSIRLQSNEYQNNLVAVTNEKTDLNNRLGTLRQEISTLEARLAERDASITNLTARKQAVDSELDTLREAILAARTERDGMMPKMNEYKNRFEDANLERNTLKAKYNAIMGTVNGYTDQVKAAKLAESEAKAALPPLQNELAIAQKTIGELRTTIESEQARVAQTNTLFAKANTSKETLQLQYESLLRLQEQYEESNRNAGTETSKLTQKIAALEGFKTKWQTLNDERSTWISKQDELNNEINRLHNSANASGDKDQQIATLNGQLLELTDYKNRWTELDTEKNNWIAQNRELKATIERLKVLSKPDNGKEQQIIQLKGQLAEQQGFQDKWTILANEKSQWINKNVLLVDENTRLKAELEAIQMQATSHKPVDKAARAEQAKADLSAAMGIRIAKATAADKDDLKRISGVGPFIETKLNNLGIFTFQQVSQFDNELVENITDAIQFFPGRIQRDNWVGQAADLFQEKNK